MRIATTRLEVSTDDGVSLADITGDLNAFIVAKGVQRGLCIVTVEPKGSGLSLAAALDEDVDDLLRLGRRHVPGRARPGSEPGEAGYVPAGVLAHCLSLAIRQGALHMGNWDAMVLIDAAGPRLHPVDVVLLGA